VAAPGSILFVCNLNKVRSPMAAALAKARSPGMRVESCGLEAASMVDPFAVAAMAELGLELEWHEPQPLEAFEGQSFERVIALTPEAAAWVEKAGLGPTLYWPTPDPTLEGGSREQRLEAYRATRKALEARIEAELG